MAQLDIAPSFGNELKDGFKPVNSWISGGIGWLDDIQQFYRERSSIEKEYSKQLSALAKKYFERKLRKSSALSVGETPTVTPGSLESASMTTWTVQLSTLESRAAEHDRFSSDLLSNLAEPLKQLTLRCEDLRKQHAEYAARLEKERDATYVELKKSKSKYDASCSDVESRRKKIESSFDHSKPKAQSAFMQQQSEMHNTKNLYLVSINITNKHKERYYHEYVPDVLDSLQDLSESRVTKLNTIWSRAATLEEATLTRSNDLIKHLSAEIPRNNPVLDSMMFLRHNVAAWQDPPDFVFEPSPVWLDDDKMIVNEPAKVFLRNALSKNKSQLSELEREVATRRKTIEDARRIKQAVREGKDNRDEMDVLGSVFSMQVELHESERRRLAADVEASTIRAAVGDVSLSAQSHNFKSQTFKIPTNCDLCGERIWGLSAKGFDCRNCGYTCHSKCEMKVPPDCPGEQTKEERRALKARRQEDARAVAPVENPVPERAPSGAPPSLQRSETTNSMHTLSSGYAASANRSVSGFSVASPGGVDGTSGDAKPPAAIAARTAARPRVLAPAPAQYVGGGGGGGGSGNGTNGHSTAQKAKMLYSYKKNADGEISVSEGDDIVVLEPDDGSGWMKVTSPAGSTGLIPASYAELLALASPDRPGSMYSASSASVSGSFRGEPNGGGSGSNDKKKGPAVAPKRGARKVAHVEAVYAYAARSEAEHSMLEGERFVVVTRDAGDGWAEVEKGGRVGSVPASYVRDC